jgi:hypothetical protein
MRPIGPLGRSPQMTQSAITQPARLPAVAPPATSPLPKEIINHHVVRPQVSAANRPVALDDRNPAPAADAEPRELGSIDQAELLPRP